MQRYLQQRVYPADDLRAGHEVALVHHPEFLVCVVHVFELYDSCFKQVL
jgi:hypothetical protein